MEPVLDNRAGEMEVFIKVVECGSFSQAGRDLRMSPSAMSKLVTRIEDRLQTRLLVRSTRQLQLTEEGETYYQHAVRLLDQIDETERLVASGGQTNPRGKLKVNASVAFAQVYILPILPDFLKKYPEIELDLTQTDGIVDLLEERADIAIRSGDLPDSDLKARKLLNTKRRIVASPSYIERYGRPQTPDELVNHNCLRFNFTRGSGFWPFTTPISGQRIDQAVRGNFLGSNGPAVKEMCIAGMGLARIGDFHIASEINKGTLIEVLEDWTSNDIEVIHAIWPGHEHLASRIRAFIDFLANRMRQS